LIAVVQRVSSAKVEVEGRIAGAIAQGLLILVGIAREDTAEEAEGLATQIVNLRVFGDGEARWARSVRDEGGSALVISQFTLLAEIKGRRPSFSKAAVASEALSLFERFVTALKRYIVVETGVFQATMSVTSVNEGPVTVICEARHKEKNS
jgi:D-aminoacyl-tRNA deacylase